MLTDLNNEVTSESTDAQIKAIVDRQALKEAKKGPIANYKEIKHIFQSDSAQKIVERINQSETDFGKDLQKQIKTVSPLSMAVVFEQLMRGRKLGSIQESFEFENRIGQ